MDAVSERVSKTGDRQPMMRCTIYFKNYLFVVSSQQFNIFKPFNIPNTLRLGSDHQLVHLNNSMHHTFTFENPNFGHKIYRLKMVDNWSRQRVSHIDVLQSQHIQLLKIRINQSHLSWGCCIIIFEQNNVSINCHAPVHFISWYIVTSAHWVLKLNIRRWTPSDCASG